jgi:SAM-dependent methyltransferase
VNELTARQRRLWTLGDTHKVSSETIGAFGPELVAACRIEPGQRVLDVAAGSGNAAIAAAAAGAGVVACDLSPELFAAGRRAAAERGVEVEWVEADAQALPFADGEFDAVISTVGAMFAPDHAATARELLRVCRPGGTLGMINFPPDGWVAEFFATFAPYGPQPPPGTSSPLEWGREEHVRKLLGPGTASLELTRRTLAVENFATPVALRDYYKAHFGPLIAVYAGLAGQPDRLAALDADLADFAARTNRAAPGEPARYDLDYLLVIGSRA